MTVSRKRTVLTHWAVGLVLVLPLLWADFALLRHIPVDAGPGPNFVSPRSGRTGSGVFIRTWELYLQPDGSISTSPTDERLGSIRGYVYRVADGLWARTSVRTRLSFSYAPDTRSEAPATVRGDALARTVEAMLLEHGGPGALGSLTEIPGHAREAHGSSRDAAHFMPVNAWRITEERLQTRTLGIGYLHNALALVLFLWLFACARRALHEQPWRNRGNTTRGEVCARCGYDRRGLVDGAACPECGTNG